MIGRGKERERAAQLLSSTQLGQGSVIALIGEAGIGKSRLLNDFVEHAVDQGFNVRTLLGTPSERGLPFAGLYALLAPDVKTRLDPLLAAAIGLQESETPPFAVAVSNALIKHLSDRAEESPMLIAIDDLQWLDPSTIAVLSSIVGSLLADRIMIAMTIRSEIVSGEIVDTEALAALPSELQWVNSTERLFLRPLSLSESVDLLVERGTTRTLAYEIASVAGGLPLALVELGRHGSRLETERDGIVSIAQLHAERFAALSANARWLCQCVAIEAHFEAVACVVGEAFSASFNEAVHAQILRRVGDSLNFTHPLLRVGALANATPADLRELHGSFAVRLDPEEHADRIAIHGAAAAFGIDDRAADLLVEFATRARARGALAESSSALFRAAELTADSTVRTQRMLGGVETLYFAGDAPGALEILDRELPNITDPSLLADAEFLLARSSEWERSVSGAVSGLERLARRVLLERPTQAANALALSAGMAAMAGDIPRGIAAAEHAIALADEHDDFLAGMLARGNLVWNLVLHGETTRAEEVAGPITSLLKVAAESESVEGVIVSQFLSMVALLDERLDEADEILSQGLAFARRIGLRLRVAQFAMIRGAYLFRVDRWDEAYLLATQHLNRSDLPCIAHAWGSAAAAQIAAAMGRDDDVETRTTQAMVEAQRLGVPLVEAWCRVARGHLHLGRGEYVKAAIEYELVRDLLAGIGLREPGYLWWHGDWLSTLIALNRHDEARQAMVEYKELAATTGRRSLKGFLARAEGQMANTESEASKRFAESVDWFGAMSMTFEQARTRLARGQWLLQHSTKPKGLQAAQRDANASMRIFVRLGARPWQERAGDLSREISSALLTQSGASNREEAETDASVVADSERPMVASETLPPPLRDLLTSAELRVALAIGDGKTNREASQELSLSEKTIEYHLQRVYRKLGVTNRSACIAFVMRDRKELSPKGRS